MKHYKNTQGEVYAYETEAEREQYGSADLVAMTQEEVNEHLNPQPTAEQLLETEIAQAKAYLSETDYIVLKIGEAMALGQDVAPLLEQYSAELGARELARESIRAAEAQL